MPVQSKLIDPNGSPKAVVGCHDQVHAGKEFGFLQHMVGVCALGAVPTDQVIDGTQMFRLLPPDEVVDRAVRLTELAFAVAIDRHWAVATADIDNIYEDLGTKPRGTGF